MKIQSIKKKTDVCNYQGKIYAFTLVELIIVMTILAILATIAFISFKSYSWNARDGNRVSTLKTIEKGLVLYNTKVWNYPKPEEFVNIIWSGWTLLSKQWIIWKNITNQIKLNKEVFDPKDNTYYIYSTNASGNKYQLGTYLEENNFLSYFPITYANVDYSKRYFYTFWNNFILLEVDRKTPISNTTYKTGLNLTEVSTEFQIYFSNNSGSGNYIKSWEELIQLIEENQKSQEDSIWDETPIIPINWECWTAHEKSRVQLPDSYLCMSGIAGSVITDVNNYTWDCNWEHGWFSMSCSATILKTPIAWIHAAAQTNINWVWNSGWWVVTKYQWSNNGNVWVDKMSELSHSETGLACNTNYTNRVIRACDDVWNCTENISLISTSTTSCPPTWFEDLWNGYWMMESTHLTGCSQNIILNGITYNKNKCILKITSITPNIYVAPSESEITAQNWTFATWTCWSLADACSALIWTFNGDAATHCTNFKNTILPLVWQDWFLPAPNSLSKVSENISKLDYIWGTNYYWSSYVYKASACWGACGMGYRVTLSPSWGFSEISSWNSYRVRCIAK